jgi:hypothetical protein
MRRILPFRTAMELAKGRESSLVNITAFLTTKSATGDDEKNDDDEEEEEDGVHHDRKTKAKTTTAVAETSA